MTRFLKYLAQVPPLFIALVMGIQGAAWLIRPDAVARVWGYDLPEGGLALSSMIGSMAGYGLTVSISLFIGVFRKQSVWYYPPAMIFLFLGLGRLIAGLSFGAPHMPERYLVEFAIAGLLVIAARSAGKGPQTG